jgi:hypothetical protein
MNAREALRAARARYIDARQYQRSAPVAYWIARIEYLCAIKAVEIALHRPNKLKELQT